MTRLERRFEKEYALLNNKLQSCDNWGIIGGVLTIIGYFATCIGITVHTAITYFIAIVGTMVSVIGALLLIGAMIVYSITENKQQKLLELFEK